MCTATDQPANRKQTTETRKEGRKFQKSPIKSPKKNKTEMTSFSHLAPFFQRPSPQSHHFFDTEEQKDNHTHGKEEVLILSAPPHTPTCLRQNFGRTPEDHGLRSNITYCTKATKRLGTTDRPPLSLSSARPPPRTSLTGDKKEDTET